MRGRAGRQGKGSGGEGSRSKRQRITGVGVGFWDWDVTCHALRGRESSWAEARGFSNLTGNGLGEAHSPLGFWVALCTSYSCYWSNYLRPGCQFPR